MDRYVRAMEDMGAVCGSVSSRIERKYKKGVDEYGGGGWLNGCHVLVEHAKDESADLSVYLEWLGRRLRSLDNTVAQARYLLEPLAQSDETVREALAHLEAVRGLLHGTNDRSE